MTRHRKLSLALAALVLVLGGGAYWLTATEAGLRFFWAQARDRLSLPLKGEVHGRLVGPLRVEGLQLDLPRTRVEAARVEVDWQPWGLLQGRLLFTRTDLRELMVTVKARPTGEPSAGPPRIPAPPLRVQVRGQVKGLTVRWGEESQVRFEQIDLDAVAGPRQLRVYALDLEGYGARLEVNGEVGLRTDGPVQLTTFWSWRPPQGEPIRGHGVITGTLARPQTDQVLDDADLRGSARGALTWIDQPLQWQAEVNARPVNIARLHRTARPLQVGGRVRAEGANGRLRWEARGEARDEALGAWKFEGEGSREAALWRVPTLLLTAKQGPARVMASGLLRTAGATAVEFDVAWSDLSLPLGGAPPRFASPTGRVAVEGSLDRYTVGGRATLARPGLPDGGVELEGAGDRNGLALTHLRAAWLDGELAGTGRLQWKPFLAWQGKLQADGIDPGRWNAQWPGRIAGRVATRGERRNGQLEAELVLDDLQGTLRGQPLNGAGRLRWRDDLLRVEALTLQSGSARLEARGDMGARWALNWEVDAARIEDLVPGLSGEIQAKGEVQGRRGRPRLRAAGRAARVAWAGREVASLTLDADMDLAGDTPWVLRLDARQLLLGKGIVVQRLGLSGEGGPEEHRLTLDTEAEGRAIHLEAHGAYAAGRWRGELMEGRMEDARLGTWRQAAPLSLTVSGREMRLERGCWQRDAARLCLALAGGAEQEWRGEAELRAFPVTALEGFIGPDFQISGVVDGRGAFGYRDGLAGLDLELAATEGAFRFQVSGGDAVATPYRRAEFTVRANADRGVEARAALRLASGDDARIDLALPRWRPGAPFADQPLRGTAEASLGELVWVSLFVPDVVATGRLESRLSVGGTLSQPVVQGNAALAGGQLAIPLLGISLSELSFAADAVGEKVMNLRAGARSGPGRMDVNGRLTKEEGRWALALKMKGENVEVARLPQAHVLATPDLQVEIRERVIRLSGSLRVPKATIDLPEIETPVQASPDVVVVDGPEAVERSRRWTIISELEVSFGDEVHLAGYGFAGRLGGQIVVVEPAGGGAVGRGELQILDGKYTAYGQDLTIEQGRLLYGNAPLNNPGIEFRAVRQVEDVKVGVLATGRLKRPEVSLYSDPAMEETRVLAFLVLGRALETATEEETDVVQRAALSLGVVGGTEVARQLASEAGIDVVNVQASAQESQASLVLGKYLSPRLYVQYAVGFWESGNAWQMRYLLDEHWTVKAESGLQSGADLLYTIEK